MKKANLLVLGLVVAMGLSSCIKEGDTFDPQAQYELEKPEIEAYAEANLVNPQFDEETGIWYEITSMGDPTSFEYKAVLSQSDNRYYPEAPDVWVNYTGKLLNGTVFDTKDEAAGVKMSFNNIIQGWIYVFFPEKILVDKDGDPLEKPLDFVGFTSSGLKKGAKVRFVVPSYLAYGNAANGKIPANSPLDFEIEVINIASPSGTGN
ncbi:FKBP-type peptidyl-prolyl cis-trans isomerase [Parapedobacter pyrenivorans]|uniref:FKBP-type peptidyl-prolyl cis-trans isomerase n=1 Tax=Parapedobacter pyrenivorans TaxID=1305674 RepID=UPI00333F5BE7